MNLSLNTSRETIIAIEDSIKLMDGVIIGDSEIFPLKHSFSDGIYVREIFICAGAYIVGEIHNHDHPNFLMSGTVYLITEFGKEIITGPVSMISKAGTKRALYAATDLVWITVHANPTNTQDLVELRSLIISKDFDSFDKLQNQKNNFIN